MRMDPLSKYLTHVLSWRDNNKSPSNVEKKLIIYIDKFRLTQCCRLFESTQQHKNKKDLHNATTQEAQQLDEKINSASNDDILPDVRKDDKFRSIYKKLMLKYHPDKQGDDNIFYILREDVENKHLLYFMTYARHELCEAFDTLGDAWDNIVIFHIKKIKELMTLTSNMS